MKQKLKDGWNKVLKGLGGRRDVTSITWTLKQINKKEVYGYRK